MTLMDIEKVKGILYEDDVLIKSFEVRTAKNNKKFGTGNLDTKYGENLGYKIWDSEVLETFKAVFGTGLMVIKASGVTDVFNDIFSLKIERISDMTPNLDLNVFYSSDIDTKDVTTRLLTTYKSEVSEKGLTVISSLLKGEVASRFMEEFAANKMHDATKYGLLNHTTKMIEITKLVKNQHPDLFRNQDEIDLFFIGVLFHDIGKVMEYYMGTMTEISFVGHQYLGTEIINGQRELITQTYGKDWYYHLITILLQHHGKFDARPRSTMAYLVHLVDIFDTHVTIFEENFREANKDGLKEFKQWAGDETFRLSLPTLQNENSMIQSEEQQQPGE